MPHDLDRPFHNYWGGGYSRDLTGNHTLRT
jgi:hypothetical protein